MGFSIEPQGSDIDDDLLWCSQALKNRPECLGQRVAVYNKKILAIGELGDSGNDVLHEARMHPDRPHHSSDIVVVYVDGEGNVRTSMH